MAIGQLTNLQMEILKIYSTNLNEKELIELKSVLANHYANKAIEEADKIWQTKNLTNDTMEDWLNFIK